MKPLTLIDKAFLIKKVDIFSSLELNHLLPIADKLVYGSAAAEEVLFEIQDQAYSIYLIISGIVVVNTTADGPFYRLGSGDFFGEEGALSGHPRAYRAHCEASTEFMTLSRPHLLAIMREYPSIAIALLERFASSMPYIPKPTL